MGGAQLFNYQNVVTTANTPVQLSGLSVNLSALGVGAGAVTPTVQLWAQVVEPPVYRCGRQGAEFHTAALRVKLNVNLNGLALNVVGGAGATLQLSAFDLYLEVARASGTIGTIDAVNRAVSLNVTPGIARLGLGQLSDSVFFNRTVADPYSSMTFTSLGTVQVNVGGVLNLSLNLRARALASSSFQGSNLTVTGPFPRSYTFGSSSGSLGVLVGSLLQNLEVRLEIPSGTVIPSFLRSLVTATVNDLLSPVLNTLGRILQPVLTVVLQATLDQVLDLLGIGIGEADFTVLGVNTSCQVTGRVYHDQQPNGQADATEVWDGPVVRMNAAAAGQVVTSTPVPPGLGTFTFELGEGSFSLLLAMNPTATAAQAPSGFVFVEPPTGTRTLTISPQTASIPDLLYGLFFGDQLNGSVFQDDGRGGGVAHDAVRQATEGPLATQTVSVSSASGTRNTTTDSSGQFTLYLPGSWSNPALSVGSPLAVTGIRDGATLVLATDANSTGLRPFALAAPSGQQRVLQIGLTGRPTLTPNRALRTEAPAVVRYSHSVTPGTTGTLSLSTNSRFPAEIYLDSNCDGTVQASERVAMSTVNVGTGWPRTPDGQLASCGVELQLQVPAEATPADAPDLALLTATLLWADRPVTDQGSATDSTTIIPGARVVKSVENLSRSGPQAAADVFPGERLRYCLTLSHPGTDPITTVVLRDTLRPALQFIPGTLRLDGSSLTDQPNDDEGDIVDATVTLALPTLLPQASHTFCFEALVR